MTSVDEHFNPADLPTLSKIFYRIDSFFWIGLATFIMVVVGYCLTATDSSREPQNEALMNSKKREISAFVLGTIFVLLYLRTVLKGIIF
jgi:glucose uptake protein GlcU